MDEALAVTRTNGLGMELHAVDVEGWMSKPHDETGGGFGSVHEQDVLTVFNGNQGIVAGQFQRSGLRGKNPCPVAFDFHGYPVNRSER